MLILFSYLSLFVVLTLTIFSLSYFTFYRHCCFVYHVILFYLSYFHYRIVLIYRDYCITLFYFGMFFIIIFQGPSVLFWGHHPSPSKPTNRLNKLANPACIQANRLRPSLFPQDQAHAMASFSSLQQVCSFPHSPSHVCRIIRLSPSHVTMHE